jgi:hypothetical protein
VPSLAICNPKRLRAFVTAGSAKDVATLLVMQGELRRLVDGVREIVGAPLIDGAFDKLIWKLHDPEFPLRLLPPYESAPDDSAARFAEWIKRHVPAWAP